MPGGPRASRHRLESRLAACAAAGYRGYWLHWRDYREQRAAGLCDAALRELFDRFGLPHRGVEFLTDWFLDSDDARAAEAAAFGAATAIGATIVNVGADFLGRGLPKRWMIERFGALCARAADRGLSVALEIVPWSDVPNVEAALPFLKPSNSGLALDCWHIFRGRVLLESVAAIPQERILCVQISDAAAAPVGPLDIDTLARRFCREGAFDLAAFAAAIDATGASVPFSIEIISPEVAAMPVEEVARRSFASAQAAFARQS